MTELEQRVAALEANYAHLADGIHHLSECVDKLNASVNSFKGAVKMLVFLAPPMGAGVMVIFKYFI